MNAQTKPMKYIIKNIVYHKKVMYNVSWKKHKTREEK